MAAHYQELMDTLSVEDRRHKTAPPRNELIQMAIQRIITLRSHLDDLQMLEQRTTRN